MNQELKFVGEEALILMIWNHFELSIDLMRVYGDKRKDV